MQKEKLAWVVALILIGMLAVQLPGSMPARDEDYAFVRTLVDIHRQVANRYVEDVPADRLRQGAIDGMLNQLDPYTVYVPPQQQKAFDQMLDGSFEGVGIQLNQQDDGRIEVVTPIDDSPAFKAGVMAGDILIKVNGTSVTDKRLPDVIKLIQGKVGSEVTLRFRRGPHELDLSMPREQVVVPTVKGYDRNPDNTWNYYVDRNEKIAYLRITQFTADTFEKVKSVLDTLLADGMRGLVMDLRFNPGGRLDAATEVCDLLIDQGVIVSTRGRSRPEETVFAHAAGTLPKFPLVVLVNGSSASAAEVVAGCLKDNRRALVIGSRTYGKGSVQELIPLEQGSGELKMTVAYYYLPSGRLVHRRKDATDWGVIPQVQVNIDPAVEQKIIRERYQTELFHKPGTAPSTTTTSPTTQPYGSDIQLQRAVDSLMALVVLQNTQPAATQPTTQPEEPFDTAPATAAPEQPD
jgi:carboxyl-terminal processing protease